MASRGQLGLGGTGSEGSGHEGRPHTAIPLKSIETEDSVLVWAQPSLPGETLDMALRFFVCLMGVMITALLMSSNKGIEVKEVQV